MRKLLRTWKNYHCRLARNACLRIEPFWITAMVIGAFIGGLSAPKILSPIFKGLGF